MFLVFFIIFFANEASAKLSHLTCSVDSMEVIYVGSGGVKRAEDSAQVVSGLVFLLKPESEFSDKGISFAPPMYSKFGYLNSQKLEKAYLEIKELGLDFPDDETIHKAVRLGAIDWQRGVQFVKYFNPLLWAKSIKTLALLSGAVVTGGISAQKSINTLSSRISINLISQKKSLVVTHGLGQQVFNLAYNNLLSGPRKDELGYVSGIALGMLSSSLPPSPADNPRFHYVVSQGDELLRSNTFANVKPNVVFNGTNPDDSGHDIIKTYFSDEYVSTSSGSMAMLDFTKEQIKRSVSGLLNNNPNCCEKKQGKLWINNCEEGDECLGGFLEKTVKLNLSSDDELELSKNSVICGDVKIETDKSTVKIDNSKLIGPLTIKGDVELKKVNLDASGNDLNYNRALIDAENQYVKIDFSGSTYTQPNILGRPQISDSVEIKSSKSEAVITGSPTIRNRVKLNDSKLKEVRPPVENTKNLASQIVLDGEFGEVELIDSSLDGKVDVVGPVTMYRVNQIGTASIQRASFNQTTISNNYYSIVDKPGIQISKDPLCDSPLQIDAAEIFSEAEIRACGNIFNDAVIQGHVRVRGEVSINGKLLGDAYNAQLEPMKVLGSSDGDYGIVVASGVEFRNRPTISGDIVFDNGTKIYNNGTYQGVKQVVQPGVTYFSHFGGGNYYGNNEISGFYFIENGLTNVKVEGGYVLFNTGDYLSTNILATASIGEGAVLKGPMYIEGSIGPQAVVEGRSLGPRGGIFVMSGAAFNGVGKRLEGGVLLEYGATITDSSINGTEMDIYNPMIAFMHLDGSTVTNSTLTGIGRITGSNLTNVQTSGNSYFIANSTLTGGSYSDNIYIALSSINGGSYSNNISIDSSSATNAQLSDNVQVFSNASLFGTIASGSAKLCSMTYGVGPYGSEYDCTDPPPIRKGHIKNDTVLEKVLSAQRESKVRHQRAMKIKHQGRKWSQGRIFANELRKSI